MLRKNLHINVLLSHSSVVRKHNPVHTVESVVLQESLEIFDLPITPLIPVHNGPFDRGDELAGLNGEAFDCFWYSLSQGTRVDTGLNFVVIERELFEVLHAVNHVVVKFEKL